jgi:GNAT superfamily N-acetyltransferase
VSIAVARLSAAEAEARRDILADILADVVEGGASVGFLRPLERAAALEFWRGVAAAVAARGRVLLVAERAGVPVGTVQLDLAAMPNQRHRADLMKLLVLRSARRLGVGRALVCAAEDEARRAGRSLITFDTVADSPAETLYRSLGYRRAGVIPRYALSSDGVIEDTSVMYKEI